MNRSTKRFPLNGEDAEGAYGIQTSLQIGSFAEAVYAPVYAVPDRSRTLVEAAGYGAHSYSASGSRSSLSRPSVRRASAKACRS